MQTPTTNPTEMLDRMIRARYSLIVISSPEEARVMSEIKTVAGTKRVVCEWSFTEGLKNLEGADPEMTSDPSAALDAISKYDPDGREKPHLFVMKDLHNMMNDAKIVRYLRDVALQFNTRPHNLILISPTFKVPADLEKEVTVIDWPLPNQAQLREILDTAERDLPDTVKKNLAGCYEKVVQAMQGLTYVEATNVLKAAVVATRELGENVIPFIIAEKAQVIKKAGVLEFIHQSATMEDVGGLDLLKEYATIKRYAFSDEAKKANVDAPKGLLMVGAPGTGKSLVAKAIAGGSMPLLRMDVGALMGGLVGQSEGNMRNALKVAEAVAPCVMWLDEIEKALGSGNGETDGGTSARVLGTLLTWMQETKAPVYTVATANDVRGLRPELLRRFDDVMSVDLPDAASREQILKVHLTKRNYKLTDLKDIVDATWGYSGAEIEKAIKSAIEKAAYKKTKLTSAMVLEAAIRIVPISVTMKESIANVRAWAKDRAIPAGNPLEAQPAAKQSKTTLDLE